MNFIERAISAISPMWSCKRQAWRAQEKILRAYDAAEDNPRNVNWRPDNRPAEDVLSVDRDKLRGRARALEQNSDIVNACISAISRNVLGLGFQMQARTENERLNNDLEALWKEWCKPRNCDITGTMSFTEMLQTMLRRKIVDGGVLIHKCFTRNGPCPLTLQLIEVDGLASPLLPKRKRDQVVGGLELDPYQRAVGYWLQPFSPDGISQPEPIYVKAEEIIFYFTKHRFSQVREVSDLAPVLERVRDANEFATNVSEKQKVEAMFAAYITRNVNDMDAGRGSFLGDPSAKQAEKHGYTEIAPGMIFDLSPGESMGALNPTGQATDAASFMRLLIRLIASGMGVSYEAMSRDMSGTTYSSARQSAIEDEVAFAPAVAQLMYILDEIYETFVISCVLVGAVDVPDFWENKAHYLQHEWIKIPRRWVDPLKEAQANIALLQAGLKTYPQIVAETGGDWREAIDTIQAVTEYGDEVGINMGSLAYGGNLSAPAMKDRTPEESEYEGGDDSAGDEDRT